MPFTVAQIVAMAEELDSQHKIQLIEQLQKSVEKKPLNDLSKYPKLSRLKSRPNVVIGNLDDLVNISWEKELNLDFPN